MGLPAQLPADAAAAIHTIRHRSRFMRRHPYQPPPSSGAHCFSDRIYADLCGTSDAATDAWFAAAVAPLFEGIASALAVAVVRAGADSASAVGLPLSALCLATTCLPFGWKPKHSTEWKQLADGLASTPSP